MAEQAKTVSRLTAQAHGNTGLVRSVPWTSHNSSCGRLIVVSAVVSDWWCCRAGAVESSSAVVAGEVVPNQRRTHRWLYHTLGYRGGVQRTPRDTRGDTAGETRPPTVADEHWRLATERLSRGHTHAAAVLRKMRQTPGQQSKMLRGPAPPNTFRAHALWSAPLLQGLVSRG